jgi:NAD(P)-dependent dehydrogenase (short-subunit alcohol dehydrogenase family)
MAMSGITLITGAASGIGKSLYEMLSARGCDVRGIDKQAGPTCDFVCDLSSAPAIMDMAARIDVPIASIAHVAGVPGTMPSATILQVNFLAPRLITRLLSAHLSEHGSIVAVSSIAAPRCTLDDDAKDWLLDLDDKALLAELSGLEGTTAYETSKALLNRWVMQQTVTLSHRKVRVNGVSPGPVETLILEDFKKSMGVDRIAAAQDLTGRHARPEDIAQAVAFLLSDQASWVNGIDLRVDGGFHTLRAMAVET